MPQPNCCNRLLDFEGFKYMSPSMEVWGRNSTRYEAFIDIFNASEGEPNISTEKLWQEEQSSPFVWFLNSYA